MAIAVAAAVGLYALTGLFRAPPNSSAWQHVADYPLQLNGEFGVAGQQCLGGKTYLYCLGGQDAKGGPRSEVYSLSAAAPPSANASFWTAGPDPYPKPVHGQSCVGFSGYVYCVGGTYDANGDDLASSYYAALDDKGNVGGWNSTTPYPIPIDSEYCTAWSSHMYCIGGNNETDGTNADATPTSSVWYASLSASGIGPWMHSTPYPADVFFPSCFGADGYVYCLGGADSNNSPLSSVYYATLSPSGVRAWSHTTAYPLGLSGQACEISSGYIFCVGGEQQQNSYTSAVFYAPLSPDGGIGAWKQSSSYPLAVGTTCALSSGYMYCVGGFDASSAGESSATYSAPLASLSGQQALTSASAP